MENSKLPFSIADHITKAYIDEYTNANNPFRLESDYREDEQRKTDYHGRELLELLQNVDDAATASGIKNAEVFIEFSDNVFTISNSGTEFTEETIRRLCHGSASNKNDDYIGNKGTGFRSLLNWGEEIEIHSGLFHVGFSKKHAEDEFIKIKEEAIVQGQLKNSPDLCVPTLHCPYTAEDLKTNKTVIKIITTTELQSDNQSILKQINEFDYFSLLFLPSITKIQIKGDGGEKTISKEMINDRIAKLSIDDREEKFLLFHNDDEPTILVEANKTRKIKTSVAVPLDRNFDFSKIPLYCFFPVRIFLTPLNCLLHGSFLLNASRDDVPNNDINRQVFMHLMKFLADVSESDDVKKSDIQLPINMLSINNKNSKLFISTSFDLFDTYFEFLLGKRILPTVNDEFVSIEDNPKFFTKEFPESLTGKNFQNLLKLLDTTEKDDLVKILAERAEVDLEYSAEDLCNAINSSSENWSVRERVEVFIWWSHNYPKSNILPHLLLDNSSQNKPIVVNDDIYFIRGQKLNIPTWTKIKQLNPDYEKELLNQLKDIDDFSKDHEEEKIFERVVARKSGTNQYLPLVKFHDADISTILSPINSSVDSYNKAIEFIEWLFDNKRSVPEELYVKLPTSDNNFSSANNLFISNELSDKLFLNSESKKLIEFDKLNISNDELEEFIEYVKELGVRVFPPIKKSDVNDSAYWKSIGNPGRQPKKSSIDDIDGLSNILQSNTETDIIRWLTGDPDLKNQFDKLGSFGTISWFYRTSKRENITDSYIKFIFETTKWINIDDKKFAPMECVFDYRGLDISPVLPVITEKHVSDISEQAKITKKDVRELFLKAGVKQQITELQSDDFYNCLQKLPKKDQSGKISEKIYREIAELDECIFRQPPDDLDVWTFNHDGKSYHEAKSSYFSNSVQINIGNYHLLKTPPRNGKFDTFAQVFGVNKFEEKYEVVQSSLKFHSQNDNFKENFSDFLKYAIAWGEKHTRLADRLRDLKIDIVSHCQLSENDFERNLERDYSLIKDKKNWLIFAKSDTLDDFEISKCIEEMVSQIANSESDELAKSLGELFRDRNNRQKLVEKEFGTIDVINQVSKNAILQNFAETLGLEYDSQELNDIDFLLFDSTDNGEAIVRLLKSHNFDINSFKETGFEYPINLIPYWETKIREFIKNDTTYKTKLYNYLIDKTDKQPSFLEEYDKYLYWKIPEDQIENSVSFIISSFISCQFPIINLEVTEVNIDDLYNKNFSEFQNSSDEFVDFVNKNPKFRSMVYFLNDGYKDTILTAYNELSVSHKSASTADSQPTYVANLKKREIESVDTTQPAYTVHGTSKFKTQTDITNENVNKNNRGKNAEKIAYDTLLEKYSSLKWTSEKSLIPSDRNKSSVYDMEYIRDDKKVYVEIKASKGEFYMSASEFKFARENSASYELYFVDIENQIIDGPHSIEEFKLPGPTPTEYKFKYIVKVVDKEHDNDK
jgi:hypothetical protein